MVNIPTSYFKGLGIKSGPEADRRSLSLAAAEDRMTGSYLILLHDCLLLRHHFL